MTCPVCGNEIHSDDMFCGKCGTLIISESERKNTAEGKKSKEAYNLNGIIGFGLIIPFVIIVAINVIVFTLNYGGMYLGGNPLIYLIGMIFPVICLAYSIVGVKTKGNYIRGNALTKAGLVINIVLTSGFAVAFIVLICLLL